MSARTRLGALKPDHDKLFGNCYGAVMADWRFTIYQPWIPLMVDKGFACCTCRRHLPTEQWAQDSLGQCTSCYENDPVAVPCHRDWDVVRRVLAEEE